jgi:hypothetical protein
MTDFVSDLDPSVAADVIQIPLSQWPCNCFMIATAFIRTGLVKGKACYGGWLGPIAAGSPFEGRGYTHHGWVEQRGVSDDKLIVDPTRWVFENVSPYVYVGPNDHYDKGGNRFREAMNDHFGNMTAPAPDGRVNARFNEILTPISRGAIYLLLGRPEHTGPVCANELFWLGNLNPERLGSNMARTLYGLLDKAGLVGVVPIDNWHDVMEGGYR